MNPHPLCGLVAVVDSSSILRILEQKVTLSLCLDLYELLFVIIIKMTSSSETQFPKNFFDIGEKSFEYVFQHKPDYVQFTIDEMKKCTGLFLEWQNYCKCKIKQTNK